MFVITQTSIVYIDRLFFRLKMLKGQENVKSNSDYSKQKAESDTTRP